MIVSHSLQFLVEGISWETDIQAEHAHLIRSSSTEKRTIRSECLDNIDWIRVRKEFSGNERVREGQGKRDTERHRERKKDKNREKGRKRVRERENDR